MPDSTAEVGEVNPYAEVVRTLVTQFTSSTEASSIAMLVYIGLDLGTKRAIVNADPLMAAAVTSFRGVIEFVAYAKAEDLADIQKAVRIGLEQWIDDPGKTVPVEVPDDGMGRS